MCDPCFVLQKQEVVIVKAAENYCLQQGHQLQIGASRWNRVYSGGVVEKLRASSFVLFSQCQLPNDIFYPESGGFQCF